MLKINKCKDCGVPLSGWRYRFIAHPVFGITACKGNICCKCIKDKKKKTTKHKKK